MADHHDWTEDFNLRAAGEILRAAVNESATPICTVAQRSIVVAATRHFQRHEANCGVGDPLMAEYEQARLLFAEDYVKRNRQPGRAQLAQAASVETHSRHYNDCSVKYAFALIDRGLAAGRHATWTTAECRCIEAAGTITALAADLDTVMYHHWGDREYYVWAELRKWPDEWQWQRVAAAMNVGTTSDQFLTATPSM